MKILFAHRNCESLGIEYISSILKQNGHKTDLIFDPGAGDIEFKSKLITRVFKYDDKILQKIKRFSPDLIAFSSMTNMFPWIRHLTKLIKQSFEIPIIVGGIHPTIAPEETINYDYIDMICRGEGEFAMLDLIDSLDSRREQYEIKNIWFKKDHKIIKNPLRPLLNDLDSLPLPDKDLFFKYGAFSIRYYIMTSRGCPYNCSYCHNHQLREIYANDKPYVRFRSVDNVINELKWALERYKFKKVYFYDDVFGMNLKWLQDFSQKYKKEINKPYKCLLYPQNITKEKLSLLKNSKCKEIDIGLESGNQRVRKDILNRNISDKEMLKSFSLLKESGIQFSTLNIIGVPTETLDDLMDTFHMNYKIHPKGALFTILYPFPKTKIYDLCFELGELNENGIKIIHKGLSSYRDRPILKRNFDYVIKFNIFAPIFLKLPKSLNKYLFRLPPIKFFRIISIIFLTTPKNVRTKLFEFILMLLRTSDYYKKMEKKQEYYY
ncbi:MAG: B12-binding domain-containing radical SAM protein [Promethearchaeota archaeon]|nr:MAG: B12-binding domain-containing radical SAM protein [Candidatus Lokiarchaeota archaeon]